jgi:hypothetical protein
MSESKNSPEKEPEFEFYVIYYFDFNRISEITKEQVIDMVFLIL